MNSKRPIPVTIVSGFLGAGKTTLLNHLLHQEHGYRIAVLVNDFGSVNIDAALIEAVDEEVVSLANGCICCSIREDLLETVWSLLERPDPPDYILIEASGVANPGAIAFTFAAAGRHESIYLDAVVTVVDASMELDFLDEETRVLCNNQLEAADLILLNKIDLVEQQKLTEIEAWIENTASRAGVLKTTFGEMPVSLLLDTGLFDDKKARSEPIVSRQFETWSYKTERPVVSLRVFNAALRELPEGVLRVKGILSLVDFPSQEVVVHRVGRRNDIRPGRPWKNTPRTQLVAIGLPASFDSEEMDRWFEKCLNG